MAKQRTTVTDELHERARVLRRTTKKTLKEIGAELGLSPVTVFKHCRDVKPFYDQAMSRRRRRRGCIIIADLPRPAPAPRPAVLESFIQPPSKAQRMSRRGY